MTIKNELIDLEQKFGGHVKGIKRIISRLDPRFNQKNIGTHEGGDRMNSCYHQYASTYEKSLEYIKNPKVIVEVGILTGIGLAIWCEMFPDARIIGLDITLDHYNKNKQNLKSLGAFTKNNPELYVFDQYADNEELIQQILGCDTIDMIIDDGAHTEKSIVDTYDSFKIHLSDKFTYLIEDHKKTKQFLVLESGHEFVESSDVQLSVIQNTK